MSLHQDASSYQYLFRSLVEAMSRPGARVPLPHERVARGRDGALLSLCRALLDAEVSYAVGGGAEARPLVDTIAATTGARRASVPEADFVIVLGNDSRGAILKAKRGAPEYPDRGATVIYHRAAAGTQDNDAAVSARGPGIKGECRISAPAVSHKEWERIRLCNDEYPLGVDCIFVLPSGEVMCLPRSVRIQVE
jgi:alpha-D-ribose 1-methylphosphonate 5-triphosphate synthase subunit PhnH